MSETNVGGILGYLRMDASQFHQELDKALAETKALTSSSGGLQDAQTKTETSTRRLGDETRKTSQETEKLGQSNQQAATHTSALATAVLTLGPALIPVGAAAAGAGIGLAGMGAAGILAIMGIKQEMAGGTAVGLAYSDGLNTLKGDLMQLEHIAASNVLGPFQSAVSALNSQAPALNTQIGELATVTGRTAGVLAGGLAAAFTTLGPLMLDVATYVEQLAQRFAGLVSDGSLSKFSDYARSVLPQVEAALENIATAAVHLVSAFAPLGGGVLSGLSMLSGLISAIPLDVLSNLVTLTGAAFLGFKTWGTLTGLIDGVSGSLERLGISVRGLQTAAGVVGVAVAALSAAFTYQAEQTRKNEAVINDFKDALIASNGVLDEHASKVAFDALQTSGAVDAAKSLGIGLDTLTSAAMGNVPAIDSVNATTKSLADLWRKELGGDVPGNVQANITKVGEAIGGTNGQLQKGTQEYNDYVLATKGAAASTSAVIQPTIGSTVALMSMFGASKETTTAINALNTSIDSLLGRELGLQGATTNVDQALLSMTDTLKKNAGSLDENTQAGIDDRKSIEGAVGALQAKRDAEIKAGASTADATQHYRDASGALQDQIGKLDGTKSAAYNYAQQLLKIPPEVKTQIDVNTGGAMNSVAALQSALAAIQSKSITITSNNVQTGQTYAPGLYGGKPAPAADGLITGVRAMAAGGNIRDGAIMRSQSPILWNEAPGGEAYIPLAPAKRARSTALLAQTNQIMGNPLGTGASPNVSVYVQAVPDGEWVRTQARIVVDDANSQQARAVYAGVQ